MNIHMFLKYFLWAPGALVVNVNIINGRAGVIRALALLWKCKVSTFLFCFAEMIELGKTNIHILGAAWLRGCGVAQRVRSGSIRARRGSISSPSACCRPKFDSRLGITGRFFLLSWPPMRRWRGTSANYGGWMNCRNGMEWMYVINNIKIN